MDTSEATQLLTWLEEERRRDKALLVELQKSTGQYEAHFSNLAHKVAELEERLTQTSTQLAQASRSDQALQQFKDEVLLEVERSEERIRKQADEREKRLRGERQETAKGLAKLGQRVEEASRLSEPLQAQQAEIQRLHKTLSGLKLQIDEAIRDGKERQESVLGLKQRIDRNEKTLAQLMQERGEEKARSEGTHEKLNLLESWAERGTQQMADLQAFGERLRQEQAQLVDQLRTVDDRRSKQLAGWGKEMRSWRADAKQVRELLSDADKRLRSEEKMMAGLDALRTQLEQDREALEHLQQTREERQRQQLEEWRKENELLWLRDKERWQQLGEENAKRDARIARIWETQIAHMRRQVGELAKLIRDSQKHLVRTKK